MIILLNRRSLKRAMYCLILVLLMIMMVNIAATAPILQN
nr:MAG TPA: Sarcoglycan complex subunit protein [Caudoviricetes sp.]